MYTWVRASTAAVELGALMSAENIFRNSFSILICSRIAATTTYWSRMVTPLSGSVTVFPIAVVFAGGESMMRCSSAYLAL
jgi:hypothetical protein